VRGPSRTEAPAVQAGAPPVHSVVLDHPAAMAAAPLSRRVAPVPALPPKVVDVGSGRRVPAPRPVPVAVPPPAPAPALHAVAAPALHAAAPPVAPPRATAPRPLPFQPIIEQQPPVQPRSVTPPPFVQPRPVAPLVTDVRPRRPAPRPRLAPNQRDGEAGADRRSLEPGMDLKLPERSASHRQLDEKDPYSP
jgi:hypothetical protein